MKTYENYMDSVYRTGHLKNENSFKLITRSKRDVARAQRNQRARKYY